METTRSAMRGRPPRRHGVPGPLAVFTAAMVVRVLSLYLLEPVPLRPDSAGGYHRPAVELVEAFKALPDRDEFARKFRAAYEKALWKGEAYPFYLASVYAVTGGSENAARIGQSLLDSLSCVLIYLLAARISSRKGIGATAGLLAAFYPPLIHSSEELMSDTPSIFLFLLSIWLLYRGMEKRGYLLILLAGLATGVNMLCRAPFLYSQPFLLAPYLFGVKGLKAKVDRLLLPGIVFCAGIFLLLAPRCILINNLYEYPHLVVLTLRHDSGHALFSGVQTPEGINVDDTESGVPVVRELLGIDDPEPKMVHYVKAYLITIWRNPRTSLKLFFSKLYLFWKCPYDVFQRPFPLSPDGTILFHQGIFALGVVGFFLSFTRWPKNALIVLPFLYTASFATIGAFLSRHLLPAMAFMIIFAAWGVYILVTGIKERMRCKMIGKLILLLLAPAILLPLTGLLTVPRMSLYCDTLTATQCQQIRFALFCLSLTSLVPLAYFLARARVGRGISLAASVLPIALAISSTYAYNLVFPVWHQWRTRLDKPGLVVRQEIQLPPDVGRYRAASLKIYLQGGKKREYDLEIKANGKVARSYEGGLLMDEDHPVRGSSERCFYHLFLNYHGMRLDELKQWITVPLRIGDLKKNDTFVVDIALSDAPVGEDSFVDIFGDYESAEGAYLFEGPSRSQEPTYTCADKFGMMGDFRVWERVRIAHPVKSSLYDGHRWRENDLSPAPGRQTGRYRIFLELSDGEAPQVQPPR